MRPASSHTAGSAARSEFRRRVTDSASRRSGCWTASAAARRTAVIVIAPGVEVAIGRPGRLVRWNVRRGRRAPPGPARGTGCRPPQPHRSYIPQLISACSTAPASLRGLTAACRLRRRARPPRAINAEDRVMKRLSDLTPYAEHPGLLQRDLPCVPTADQLAVQAPGRARGPRLPGGPGPRAQGTAEPDFRRPRDHVLQAPTRLEEASGREARFQNNKAAGGLEEGRQWRAKWCAEYEHAVRKVAVCEELPWFL